MVSRILGISLMVLTMSLACLADCEAKDCVNKCCSLTTNTCTDDLLQCSLSKNSDFTALIASLALVAFFFISKQFVVPEYS